MTHSEAAEIRRRDKGPSGLAAEMLVRARRLGLADRVATWIAHGERRPIPAELRPLLPPSRARVEPLPAPRHHDPLPFPDRIREEEDRILIEADMNDLRRLIRRLLRSKIRTLRD